MKRILLFATVAALALVSCKKDETVTPEIKANQTEYTLPLEGTEETTFYVEFTTNVDWTAAVKEDVEWISISPKKGVAGAGKIKIVAVANSDNDPRTAVLVVTAGTAQQEFTLTQPQKDAFSLVKSSAEIDRNGGTVEVKVMTNIDYTVTIPSDVTWITKADTKAYGEQTTVLNVAAYDELDGERVAEITVSAAGFDNLTFTVTQSGPKAKIWSVDMHDVMNRVASYVPADGEEDGTAVSIAVWGDKVVVCAGDGSKPVLLDKATGEKKGELDTKDAKAMYVTNDDAGNLVFCNRVYNYWTSYVFFTIWYMKPGDTEPTKLVSTHDSEYYPSYIGAGLNVRGDITKNAAIVAPWNGVIGVTGENMVLAWNVKNGVAEAFKKITVNGFPGISWWAGYWCEVPLHFPGIALMGDDLSNGFFLSVYDTNTICYVGSDNNSKEVYKLYVPYDQDGEEIDAVGNYNSGCLDCRNINGKTYIACDLSSIYGGTILRVYDSDSKQVYEAFAANYLREDDPKDPHNGLISTTAAVRLEATSDGFNCYHISNSSSSIEAFSVPVK